MEESKSFDQSHEDLSTCSTSLVSIMKTEMENIWKLRIKRLRAKVVRIRKIKRIYGRI
jgi:hypothetical protein